MTSIPSTIYQELSTPERIRATVAAIARGDDAEIENLYSTCMRKCYEGPDHEFSDGLERLRTLGLAVTCDLSHLALDLLTVAENDDQAPAETALAIAASLETAWLKTLADLGVDPDDACRALPPRHPMVFGLLVAAEGRALPEVTERHHEAMRAYLATC